MDEFLDREIYVKSKKYPVKNNKVGCNICLRGNTFTK